MELMSHDKGNNHVTSFDIVLRHIYDFELNLKVRYDLTENCLNLTNDTLFRFMQI